MKDQNHVIGHTNSDDASGLGISRGKFIYYLLMLLPVLALLLGACGGGQEGGQRHGHP